MPVFLTIVLDGVGIGAQPDADRYGDEDSHTLGHVCAVAHPHLPHLANMGLGNIAPLAGVVAVTAPLGSYGKMQEVSAGKDSTTGHWELAGIKLMSPFPTFPDGFPDELIKPFLAATGYDEVLGNCAASGTAIIDEFGPAHEASGQPIVYTSADSVFQIAAHKDVIALDELYRICDIARDQICVGPFGVGRVIARPFVGTAGAYQRVSAERKDYSMLPPAPPLQSVLQEHGVLTISIGKVADLFGAIGFDVSYKTKSNAEGIQRTLQILAEADPDVPTFVWVNLVDFDQEYGHRNNPDGFARALEAFDAALPTLCAALPDNDSVLFITADHGNDPTTPGTDHSREYVPALCYQAGSEGVDLGLMATFADHAATVAAYFQAPYVGPGKSFKDKVAGL
ncbi:MAG: phosphopentomutase [Bacteroidota bacterium]